MDDTRMIYIRFGNAIQKIFLTLAITLAVLIVGKSLAPAMPSLHVTHMDKVIHILAYLILGGVTFPALARVKPLFVWLGLCGFGVGIEVAQGLMTTGRTADILDVLANGSGALLALLGWVLISRLLANP